MSDSRYQGGRGVESAGRKRGSTTPQTAGPPTVDDSPDDLSLNAVAASVVKLANRAMSTAKAHVDHTRKSAKVARNRAEEQLRLDQDLIAFDLTNDTQFNVARAEASCAEAAPGVLGASWPDVTQALGQTEMLDAASFVRCGALHPSDGALDRGELPLLLPLLDQGNVVVRAPQAAQVVGGIVQEIILRALLGTGAGQLELATYDPLLTSATAPFASLRQVSEDLVRPTIASEAELRDLLGELSQDVRRISDMYQGIPTTLGEFRRSVRQPIERYQLVTILNYPTGFDETSHGLLQTLLRTGPSCGISFVIHHDVAARLPDHVDPETLYLHAAVIRCDGQIPTVDGLAGFNVSIGSAPSQAILEPAMASLREQAKAAAAPRIDFLETQIPPGQYWSESSAERLVATIGRQGHQAVEITLGDEKEQRHNILVTGAVGQGKSNLLMVLVHSWAIRYSPSELQLYLLDFKDGLTLFPLAPQSGQEGWLPHARVIGLESDREYGVAVLQYLVKEFERRAKVIRPHGDNITRFRSAQPDVLMPRIVLMLDEFQDMFAEDDDTSRSALKALDQLSRKGRAYGIHMVLASQTLSGITAMMSKQDGIFGQFPYRLALHNSPAESRVALDPHNLEAARLRYRGEVVVNRDFGQIEANQRAVVAYAEPSALASLRRDLWARVTTPGPLVFNGALPADLTLAMQRSVTRDSFPRALVGMPVAVEREPVSMEFRPDSGRHLSILGAGKAVVDGPDGDDEEARPSAGAVILQSAAISIAGQHAPGSARFVVWNLLSPKSNDQVVVETTASIVESFGHVAAVHDSSTFQQSLSDLAEAVRSNAPEGIPTYILAFGMDRAPRLQEFDFDLGSSPLDGLQAIWRDGAQLGIHLLGWWANPRSYQDHLGMQAHGLIDGVIALRMTDHDTLDLFGPFVSWKSAPNRALFRDVAEDSNPRVIIPFGPTSAAPARMDQVNRR